MALRPVHSFAAVVAGLVMCVAGFGEAAHAQWVNGPPADEDYFPIAVWLQRPEDAATWRAAGVNLYNGLWQGPTTAQLDALRAAGMQTIATFNGVGEAYDQTLPDGRPVIVGWLMQDEPDNAQPDGQGGYGPPVDPAVVQAKYNEWKTYDDTRPIFLNLGQGIAWDNGTWYGQGGGITPDDDYPQYILGSDMISFDIYPMSSGDAPVAGDAWRVALGVDRLTQYAPQDHIVWAFIETGDINANGSQATLDQIRAEVWMALIHGADGITYFIHGKTSLSNFDDRALLRAENADRLAGVTAINQQIHSLASVLKTEDVEGLVTMADITGDTPVDFMVKQHEGMIYLIAVGMRDAQTTKQFTFQGLGDLHIDVLGEDRQLLLEDGKFTDTFDGYEAHVYRLNPIPEPSALMTLGIAAAMFLTRRRRSQII